MHAVVHPAPRRPDSPSTPRTPDRHHHDLFVPDNRNSTASSNSSIPDQLQFDWKPDQIRLLARTLDALPPQLVTPFNGPIPPSNLLDKIARGVSKAKGPLDWPHSLRATRVKLIELSRARAKEENSYRTGGYSDVDMDEASDSRYLDGTSKISRKRRPLYKQSSMEFMNNAVLRADEGIELVTDRLQQSERLIAKSNLHPYAVPVPRSRLASPACFTSCSSRTGTSTPSSSTLNTLSSFSATRILRRTSSNLSSTSASSISIHSCTDPRVQRVRRSESLYNPAKDIRLAPSTHKKENLESSPLAGAKRAPSFGALAQESRRDRHVLGSAHAKDNKDASAYISSDEEEKIRAKGAKKIRVKDASRLAPAVSVNLGTPLNTPPPVPPKKTRAKVPVTAPSCLPCKSVSTASSKSHTPTTKKTRGIPRDTVASLGNTENKSGQSAAATTKETSRKLRATPMTLKRNPSMFGAELPPLVLESPHPAPRLRASPVPAGGLSSEMRISSPVLETSPSSQRPKTLRRVQRVTLGRRISFGSLPAPGEDADAEGDDEDVNGMQRERQRQRELGQLGSAFQLR
ncbi:hypothetical protein E4T56_gene9894 [Termitomyces sp. T112]|nr:hypothetical protein E4T56_gene9894 [Termitomyces sp. T112]KAH0585219.1 hypothetical protein H2248_008468 [Termitomyces sp. 'cryptogamus']